MQEHRIDGPDQLTPNASLQMLQDALEDDRNLSVTMHKPGSVIEKDGAWYVIGSSGQLIKAQGAESAHDMSEIVLKNEAKKRPRKAHA